MKGCLDWWPRPAGLVPAGHFCPRAARFRGNRERQTAALSPIAWARYAAAMSVTIYHNPRCGKSRQTLSLLRERGIEPRIVEYLETPPSTTELKTILAMLGMSAQELLRKREAAEAGIDPGKLSEGRLIEAMVKNPIVIERPIVVNGNKAAIGRPPEAVVRIL
jgi:arsenate reductase